MAPNGKKRARQVEVVRPTRLNIKGRNDNPAQWGTASLFAIPAFIIFFVTATFLWKIPGWVAGFYLGTSVVCFIAYAMDKSAAAADRRRIRESTLLNWGLVGGWPGAIVAQQVLRHKSNKASFRAKFWGTVIANVLGFIVLNSPLAPALRV